MASRTKTNPAVEEQTSWETRTWSLDVANDMDPAEMPSAPVMKLEDVAAGALYPDGLIGGPTVIGTIIYQQVGALTRGHSYDLTWIAVTPGDTLSWTLRIEVPR